jgi:hypothetical protein
VLRKGDSIRWTAYLDECLHIVDTQKECESDALLVQLIKIRLICERVNDAPWSGAMTEADCFARPPEMFYLRSLANKIRDFKSNVPSELMDNSK